MTLTERLAWALYVSEGWYGIWEGRHIYNRLFSKSYPLYAKTRAVVLHDRVLVKLDKEQESA